MLLLAARVRPDSGPRLGIVVPSAAPPTLPPQPPPPPWPPPPSASSSWIRGGSFTRLAAVTLRLRVVVMERRGRGGSGSRCRLALFVLNSWFNPPRLPCRSEMLHARGNCCSGTAEGDRSKPSTRCGVEATSSVKGAASKALANGEISMI